MSLLKNFDGSIGEKVAGVLGLPETTLLKRTYIQMFSNHEVVVEGATSVLLYSEDTIKLCCNEFVVQFLGEKLSIKNMTSGIITVGGKIKSVEFLA